MDANSPINPIVVVKGTDKKPAFFKRIQAPFSKLSLPNRKFAGALVALVLVFGVGLGAFLVQRQTQLAPRASENGLDLKIEPAAVNATVNQEFSVDVVLNAKQASASAAQVKVTFDSQKLQLINTTIGSFMPVTLQQPTPSAGAVEFVVGTSTPHGGSGSIATLRFKALVDLTTTTVAMDSANTIVTVVNSNDNQVGDMTPATVTVGAVASSPTAFPSADPYIGFNPNASGNLSNNLVAYWKMDETTGNTLTDIRGGFNATATNATIVDGKIAKGRNVVLTNSALTVNPATAFATDYMTVAGWIKPTGFGVGNFATIFNYRPQTNAAGFTMEYAGYNTTGYGQGQIQCQIYLDGTVVGAGPGLLSPVNSKLLSNTWNHVACSYDGTTSRMYINGVQVATAQSTGKIKHVANMKIEMGRNIVSGEGINGALDEFGYWSRALTTQEITDLYNSGQGNTYASYTPSTQPETSLLLPAKTPVTVGQEFTLPVQARSDIENANLFVAKINFPKDLLEVVSIDTTGSFVSSWAEQFYDNQTGQISLVGGVTNPGYKTNNAEAMLATIHFRAKSGGTALVDMTSQSQIFSNATNQNILQKTQDVNIVITGTGTVSPSPTSTASPSVAPSPSVVPSPSGSCSTMKGDGNGDCVVNLTDLSIMLSNFSASNPVPAGKELLDFNDDNRINSFDFSRMADKLFEVGVIKRRS